MFSEGGFKALTVRASARVVSLPWRSFSLFSSSSRSLSSALYSSIVSLGASRAILPLLAAEAAALALAAGSGKIPAFLFTAVRALLTF
jgi:hypothetical protein